MAKGYHDCPLKGQTGCQMRFSTEKVATMHARTHAATSENAGVPDGETPHEDNLIDNPEANRAASPPQYRYHHGESSRKASSEHRVNMSLGPLRASIKSSLARSPFVPCSIQSRELPGLLYGFITANREIDDRESTIGITSSPRILVDETVPRKQSMLTTSSCSFDCYSFRLSKALPPVFGEDRTENDYWELLFAFRLLQ